MKVALLGAPNSGKSKLANALARKLNHENHNWQVIDGYVNRLSDYTGNTYGPIFDRSAFKLNLEVIAKRWIEEDHTVHVGMNSISCGTIFEDICYAAAQGIPIHRISNEQLILEETQIAYTMMSALGLLADLTFDYDVLFFLPCTDDPQRSWRSVINAKLPEVLAGQFKEAIVLRGAHKDKVKEAYDIIKQIQTTLATYDQSSIRRSTDAGTREESGPEHLSDLSQQKS